MTTRSGRRQPEQAACARVFAKYRAALEQIAGIWHSADCAWVNPTGDYEPDCDCHRAIARQALDIPEED